MYITGIPDISTGIITLVIQWIITYNSYVLLTSNTHTQYHHFNHLFNDVMLKALDLGLFLLCPSGVDKNILILTSPPHLLTQPGPAQMEKQTLFSSRKKVQRCWGSHFDYYFDISFIRMIIPPRLPPTPPSQTCSVG